MNGPALLLLAQTVSGSAEVPLLDLDAWVHDTVDLLPRDVDLGGVLAVDLYDYDSRDARDDGPFLDRATLRVDGRLDPAWSWRVAPDLVGRDTRHGLEEAWLGWDDDVLRVRLGLVRVPIGLESSFREEDLAFVGWSFPTYLTARTDVGARVLGEHGGGVVSWDAALTAGAGSTRSGEDRDEPQLSARLVSYPFGPRLGVVDPGPLDGVFLGVGYAYTPDYDGELDVLHPFRLKTFDTPELEADGSRWLHLQAGWDLDSVRVLWERARGSLLGLELPGGGDADLEDQITAWTASVAWTLSGEPYDSRPLRQESGRPGPFPARPLFGPRSGDGGAGAFELALAYSNGDMDRDFFALGITTPQVSSQEFRTFSAALNWYPAEGLRATAQVVRSLIDDDLVQFGGQGRDTSFVLRLQWVF